MTMLRDVKSTQRLPRILGIRVNGTGTAAIEEGSFDATLVDNGTGDYTLTLVKPFARKPVIALACETTDCYAEMVDADNSASVIHVLTKNNADAATDAVFHVIVLGSDAVDPT
jgi:hypothetical protein